MELFNNGTVKVTEKIFEVPGTQYPIKNIGAIKTLTEKPSRNAPITLCIVGLILIPAYGFGILLILLGIYLWTQQKPTYYIIVFSAGTESKAYSSFDHKEILKIQSALNSALGDD